MSTDIVITGAGALSAAIVQALLPPALGSGLRVALLSRASDRLWWLARCAAARAAGLGSRIHVEAQAVDWEDGASLCRTLRRLQPRLVLHTASLQSPWALSGADDWSNLVRVAGYGLTLPLHLLLAWRLGRVLSDAAPGALFVNACYPDAVNPMLRAAGIPVLCGLGNVGILALLMATDLKKGAGEMHMIAHHCHVAGAISGAPASFDYLHAWYEGRRVDRQAREWARKAFFPSDARLNDVTGVLGATLASSLLGLRDSLATHLPGPLGFPGGYPVQVSRGEVRLRLPAELTESDAIGLNISASAYDGVVVERDGVASMIEPARARVRAALPGCIELDKPMRAAEAEPRASLLLAARASLRGRD